MSAIKAKAYKCSRCGFEKQISTNHFGECYSLGTYNACPACPPWAKYPQFGGSTTWVCQEKPPEGETIPPPWKKITVKVEL